MRNFGAEGATEIPKLVTAPKMQVEHKTAVEAYYDGQPVFTSKKQLRHAERCSKLGWECGAAACFEMNCEEGQAYAWCFYGSRPANAWPGDQVKLIPCIAPFEMLKQHFEFRAFLAFGMSRLGEDTSFVASPVVKSMLDFILTFVCPIGVAKIIGHYLYGFQQWTQALQLSWDQGRWNANPEPRKKWWEALEKGTGFTLTIPTD